MLRCRDLCAGDERRTDGSKHQKRQDDAGRADGQHAGYDRSHTKLMIAEGVITEAEFKAQLSTERGNYMAVLKRMP